MKKITTYKNLHVYRNAFHAAMSIFKLTKTFPAEEKYSLVDQVRRSSRSVCAKSNDQLHYCPVKVAGRVCKFFDR